MLRLEPAPGKGMSVAYMLPFWNIISWMMSHQLLSAIYAPLLGLVFWA
jgi:hypothetical protein